MALLLRWTPNLKSIRVSDNFEALIKKYLPKLKAIKIQIFSYDGFEKFANLYNKQIKKISFDKWCEQLGEPFLHLSRFENLESFNIDLRNHKLIEDFLSMAENLK
jgi:hypothetical protein